MDFTNLEFLKSVQNLENDSEWRGLKGRELKSEQDWKLKMYVDKVILGQFSNDDKINFNFLKTSLRRVGGVSDPDDKNHTTNHTKSCLTLCLFFLKAR